MQKSILFLCLMKNEILKFIQGDKEQNFVYFRKAIEDYFI